MNGRGVAEEFAEIAAVLRNGRDTTDIHSKIVAASVRVIDNCDHASIAHLRNGDFHSVAVSDAVARRMDELQRETGEGPCLDAARDAAWEHHADLAQSRDNEFRRRLYDETPIRSILGFRLVHDERKSGVLNLASDKPHAFSDEIAESAAVLAAFATVAVAAADAQRRSEELRDGLETNREIGVAVGILMATHQIDREEAFARLRRSSQALNRKLRDVAHELVETHRLSAR